MLFQQCCTSVRLGSKLRTSVLCPSTSGGFLEIRIVQWLPAALLLLGLVASGTLLAAPLYSTVPPTTRSARRPQTISGTGLGQRSTTLISIWSSMVIVTSEAGDTLFLTVSSSSGSKCYHLADASSYREGFEPRFRDQRYSPNITGVAINQCSFTANTVEFDGTTVDKVKLFHDC